MHDIKLGPPEIGRHTVTFRWTVEPETPLYRRTHFTLRFPESVDLLCVPRDLWWTLMILCLHSHWMFLRPCRVHLPVTLPAGQREFWLRLLDARIPTLEVLRGSHDFKRCISIIEQGPALGTPELIPDTDRCATAYSSGKDSLLQTGLLTELAERPLLVTTTAPMSAMHHHSTERRRRVLAQMASRPDVELIEVYTDFRLNWRNSFPRSQGYTKNLNQQTDTLLYTSCLAAVAAAKGATHLFLAAETECHETREVNGRIILNGNTMYSGTLIRAVQTILKPFGFRYSSLTAPLYWHQIQQLLSVRYTHLRGMQYSCWRVGPTESACARCHSCRQNAFLALAVGAHPADMEIDLLDLLQNQQTWSPCLDSPSSGVELPTDFNRRNNDIDTVRLIQTMRLRDLLVNILRSGFARWRKGDVFRALRDGWILRRRMRGLSARPLRGYRARFLRHVDPLVRDCVGAIYAEYFDAEIEDGYADDMQRMERLVRWIVDPIEGAETAAPLPPVDSPRAA